VESFWEANSHSASQEIPCLLCNLWVHYCIHKSLPPVPVLRQLYLVHTFSPYFSKIHSNIMFSSIPRSFEWSHSFSFPTKILYAFLKNEK